MLGHVAIEALAIGDFVAVRGRRWLVQDVNHLRDHHRVKLSCIEDDAQGERLEVVWEAEIASQRLDDAWSGLGTGGTDDGDVFGAYLRTIRWQSATAADRTLLQAPFRAGIRLDAYQLLPLQKALALPRANLLIADDVGLGKTVEAGLILRELLLRRRVDFTLVAAPASMTLQWQDELRAKFGLDFRLVDREFVQAMRREHGFGVKVWTTGNAFLISHNLLAEEDYVADLRSFLGEFRAKSLLILDEAHHAAPSSGRRYGVDSQFTRCVRDFAPRFEHRLFLSATPHNGHSNSFSSLLEMLDPNRFTRGMDIEPRHCEAVMVRRLKSDLRAIGHKFPERVVDELLIDKLPADTPELALAALLDQYQELREQRIKTLPPNKQAQARLIFSGLQQRLLSSLPAFLKTLRRHRATLEKQAASETAVLAALDPIARQFAHRPVDAPSDLEPEQIDAEMGEDTDGEVEVATRLGSEGAGETALRREIAAVDAMLAIAEKHRYDADERVKRLCTWLKEEFHPKGRWTGRRLIVFTEWVDTLNWLRTCLAEAIEGTDRAEERIAVIRGTTDLEERERIKQAFNEDPAKEPVRLLLATDAAREGINLQARCADLVHFDLPWNPARLEQRNGRIDRKLQTADKVFCRYFRYAQRPEDVVLQALVRKTETIREQLGSAGQVIAHRLESRIGDTGIRRAQAIALAKEVESEDGGEGATTARREMDDEVEARRTRLQREEQQLKRVLEDSRKTVGVESADLEQVVGVALARLGVSLPDVAANPVGKVDTFRLNPAAPGFAKDAGWAVLFDELRKGRPGRRESLAHWRKETKVRAIAFAPPIDDDDRDAPDVVQLHVEHRLVRRLLSRFVSQGFQSGLQRVSVLAGDETRPRVVLLGRLCLYGSEGQRLHERILSVSAWWQERAKGKPLTPFGADGEAGTLERLEKAFARRSPAKAAIARMKGWVERDVEDLLGELRTRAQSERKDAERDLTANGEREAKQLKALLESQRRKIREGLDDRQGELFPEQEQRQREADRRSWQGKLGRLDRDIEAEPDRVKAFYGVAAQRLEPVGLVYLLAAS